MSESAFLVIKSNFWEAFCPRQRSCPGQVVSSKNRYFLPRKGSAPGSAAAPDKWRVQKIRFLEKVLSQAAQLPQTSGFFNII